jgi:hypothetical protein
MPRSKQRGRIQDWQWQKPKGRENISDEVGSNIQQGLNSHLPCALEGVIAVTDLIAHKSFLGGSNLQNDYYHVHNDDDPAPPRPEQ